MAQRGGGHLDDVGAGGGGGAGEGGEGAGGAHEGEFAAEAVCAEALAELGGVFEDGVGDFDGG